MPGSAPPCASRCRAFRVSNMPADGERDSCRFRMVSVPPWHEGYSVCSKTVNVRVQRAQYKVSARDIVWAPPYVMAASGSMAIAEGSSPRYMPDTPSAADTCAVPDEPRWLVAEPRRHSKQAQQFQHGNQQ